MQRLVLILVLITLGTTACSLPVGRSYPTPEAAIAASSGSGIDPSNIEIIIARPYRDGIVALYRGRPSIIPSDRPSVGTLSWVSYVERYHGGWVTGTASAGTDGIPIGGALTITGGGLGTDKWTVGWAYGAVLDPRVKRVLVEYTDGTTDVQTVEGEAFLFVKDGEIAARYHRVQALDAAGNVLAEGVVDWPQSK